MKKFGILALTAVFAALGVMAMAGCGSNNLSDSTASIYVNSGDLHEDSAKDMTAEDVAVVGGSLQAMAEYNGGYTVKEDFNLEYKVSGYTEYNSTMTMSSFITYDDASKKMGTGTTLTGTNMYAGIDTDIAYYTIPGGSGYTQYIKYVDDSNNIYSGAQYAAADVGSMDYYYTDLADCVQNALNLDLSAGAAVTTVQDMAVFWQGMLQDNIDTLASTYGFVFDFASGECQTSVQEGAMVYCFSATASASAEISGERYTDDITYFVNVQLDGTKVSKISTEIKQVIIATQTNGQRLKMTADSFVTEEFIYAYDAALIPEDFSGYTIDGAQVA